MKSITIHNLEEPLNILLKKKARQKGTSLNKTIKGLLEEALGAKPGNAPDHKEDFRDLCGVWSVQEAERFEKSLGDFEIIDPEDWE